ncbi:uncharacterized protein LOC135847650 isoform X2 [Planococcus citri]
MKCCRHDCGVVCMTPTQLDLVPGLPPKPTNVLAHVNESEITSDGLPIYVRWTFHSCSAINQSVQFVLEEKHSYFENGTDVIADTWNYVKRTHRKHAAIKNLFQPGLYYQFRVYSVSENGTLGPSLASSPYQVLPNITELSPGKPLDFGVGAQSWGNGSLRYLLVWQKPISVVPVFKYRLIWSMLKNNSLLQHEKYLAGNLEHYWMSNVLPKTDYFFEIFAVVKFDDKKLAGKAARILVRTHDYPPPKTRRRIEPTEVDVKYRDSITTLQVNKLYWIEDNLFASVIWEPISDDAATNYSITWIPSTRDCRDLDGWYVAQTVDSNFEIYDLTPGCDYDISIKVIYDQILYTGDTFLPLESCTKKLSKSKPKIRKDFNLFASADFMKQFQNKPIEIVDCPLPRNNGTYIPRNNETELFRDNETEPSEEK